MKTWTEDDWYFGGCKDEYIGCSFVINRKDGSSVEVELCEDWHWGEDGEEWRVLEFMDSKCRIQAFDEGDTLVLVVNP